MNKFCLGFGEAVAAGSEAVQEFQKTIRGYELQQVLKKMMMNGVLEIEDSDNDDDLYYDEIY